MTLAEHIDSFCISDRSCSEDWDSTVSCNSNSSSLLELNEKVVMYLRCV